MVRKIKSLKKATLTRKGYVNIIDDINLPISTKGDISLQNLVTEYEKSLKLPKLNQKPASAEQLKELNDYGYKIDMRPVMIREWDKTSPEFLELIKKRNQFESVAIIAINVDLNYKITQRKELWEDLELKDDKDYIGLVNWLIELDLKNEQITEVKEFIEGLRISDFKTYEQFENFLSEYND